MILQLCIGAAASYLTWSLICMETNVRRARAMQIPLIRVPIDPMNVLWLTVEPLLFRVLDLLPFSYGSFGRYSRRGWHFRDKDRSHIELGPVWALVTPREIYLHVSDRHAINEVFARRADFRRPQQLYKMLDLYGPNVATVTWSDWQRQRKFVAAPFNENTNTLVWMESLNQANDMLQTWLRNGKSGTRGVAKDTRTLSLDVLAATGFRKSYKFRGSSEEGSDDADTRNYRDALKTVLDNALLLMIASPRLMSLPLMPKSWVRIGQATKDFRQYMMDTLNEETALIGQGRPGSGSLMTAFVRALEDNKGKSAAESATVPTSRGLTVGEILGNIFVINFAGHDTTANTLAFAILLLAAYPLVQDWVGEELREIIQDESYVQWDYQSLFPRLKRCQAVLLETLRLFPPILALPKWTNHHPQPLNIGDKTLSIPARTAVLPSLLAVQMLPEYWDGSPHVWQPSRWLSKPTPDRERPVDDDDDLASQQQQQREEEILVPLTGTYFPWSDGPQNCPGKRFAQVEVVAVLACLFRDHRVRIALEPGEDFAKARRRVLGVLEDCEQGLLLRMRRADGVRLVWDRRGGE